MVGCALLWEKARLFLTVLCITDATAITVTQSILLFIYEEKQSRHSSVKQPESSRKTRCIVLVRT